MSTLRCRLATGRMLVAVTALLVAPIEGAARADDAAPSHFDQHIAPLLARRCLDCHNVSARKGGLDLSSQGSALAGGESGAVIVPRNPEESLLWQRVSADEMPPKQPLTPDEKTLLKNWLAAGAVWGTDPVDIYRYSSNSRAGYDWWSLQPFVQLSAPADTSHSAFRSPHPPDNAIDAFLREKLHAANLSPSPPADRRTLIRRLTFDLVGLPPSPEEVSAFLADAAPDAYERLVERLLASPHFGERWARHWLDVARFGESQGFERDKLRLNAWRYRDWLVDAFNADMPYHEFARWQLAGDVLWPGNPHAVIATGFLVAGPFDEVGQNQQSAAMKAVVRQDELEDLISVVGQTFLGLTVHCARCHDHKFDPIRQVEYYRLAAALAGVRHGERSIANAPLERQAESAAAAIQGRIDSLTQQLAALEAPFRRASAGESDQPPPEEELAARMPPTERQRRAELQLEINQLREHRTRAAALDAYCVLPRPPEPTHVLHRGNPAQPGDAVTPGGVAAVGSVPADFDLPADAPDDQRRIKLAEWIVAEGNPLFARVIVNRLWHYHFGVGLVETPSDFGFNGGRPSHPELLDWLAGELIRSEWSLKHIHRLIVTSAAYRQSSASRPEAAEVDAQNRLLWRKSPVRLDAEELRDAILCIAGQMNPQMGGPGYYDFTTFIRNTQFYEPVDPVGESFHRRSLYRTWVRSGRNQFLDVFDCPDPSTKTPNRAVTTTPLQALALLNNSFVLRMSDALAQRLERECGDEPADQVCRVYQLVYSRPPDAAELRLTAEFARTHGLPELCRVMFNSNEFLYVE